ncbi:hypothetical protein T4D_9035 [Trichinella pseudospiralis]|uniref:Uncharacterized protein n=1 Tax=Trichinella pseudospiralis TaxID=6337 RepID=A0A0V1F6X5_TRIPS|nr:hypothetical protein T4D_9035 [Trichinella pseudospiralis]
MPQVVINHTQYRPQVVIKIRKSVFPIRSNPIPYPIRIQLRGPMFWVFLVDNDNQVPVDCIINPRFDYLNH